MALQPISEKQRAFITDLLKQRVVSSEDEKFILENMDEMSVNMASQWIERLLTKPKRQTKWLVPATIPDGRYAVLNSNQVWVFFRIVTRNPDTADERRYVQKVLGSPGDFRYVRVTAEEWRLAVKTIEQDPGLHSTLFGLQVGACGVCGSPLTDPDSIALGIGPICARKMDW